MMQHKTQYLVDISNIYYSLDRSTVTFSELTNFLNAEEYRTEYRTEYSCTNPRGMARLVRCAYHRLVNEGRIEDAVAISLTFTNDMGQYVYS